MEFGKVFLALADDRELKNAPYLKNFEYEGYAMEFFQHPQSIVETSRIGNDTRIWAFVHVLPGAKIGCDCNICDHVFIENDVAIGNRVTIKSGVQLWDGIRIEDDVFIGPNVTFTNDKFPRSKHYPEQFTQTVVCMGASIGANATILPGLRIGGQAMIGAGAVVTRDVPSHAIVTGNPARIIGYVDTLAYQTTAQLIPKVHHDSIVTGVRLINLKHVEDMRGNLCAAEWHRDLPFVPRRIFYVYNVPNSRVRGEHAHKTCHQFLVCVHGFLSVVVDDGEKREEYILDKPWLGLYIPPRIWGIQYKYSPDAVLMVFASHEYESSDYIRDYEEFRKLKRS